jgi:mono/diheme cytochrome c family protein
MVKRLLVMVFILLTGAMLTTPAEAAGCRAVVRRNVVVVEKKAIVVEKVAAVVAQFVPIPVLQYSATYAPGVPYTGPSYGQQGHTGGQGQDAVLAALQRLEQRLAGLERRAGLAPPEQDAPPMKRADDPDTRAPTTPGFAAFAGKYCAACHDAQVAARDGGKFVLTTGTALSPLTDRQKLRIIERIRAGEMPPANNTKSVKPPTDEDFDAALAELVKTPKGSP